MIAQSPVQTLENHTDRMIGAVRALQAPTPGAQHIEFSAQSCLNEVGGYLSAICFLRGALEAMAEEVAILRTRDEASRRTITEFRDQILSAAAIQRDLLPTSLPKVARLDVRLFFRPADAVSGDLYDVHRIDDTHVGFVLADATGHGLPGGFLATFVHRSLRGGQRRHDSEELLQPDEVLLQVNRDLLDAGFTDCPFVTALYAVYHESTRTLTWARGGAPFPTLVRDGEHPRQIKSEGPLIGAVEEPEFEVKSLVLEPGDTVVFHTDGLEALVGDQSMQRGMPDFSDGEWFRQLSDRPFERQIEDLETRFASIDESDWHRDDVTVVALYAREDFANLVNSL